MTIQKNLNIEENYELYDVELRESEMAISSVIRDVKKNKAIVPRIQRKIVWNKKKVKDLIISLFKGIPIGDITMWYLHNKNPNIEQYRTIFNTSKQIPEWINFLIDGLQRCSALSAVFATGEIAIDEKFHNINLYYNIIKDIFLFKEEIKDLDITWINLKETLNETGDNAIYKEEFTKKINDILAGLDREDDKKVTNRIERIFGLVNKKLKIATYDGEDINVAFDLLVFKNYGVQYSILDLLYSVISNFNPMSRQLIEKFSESTKQKLNNNYFKIHDILNLAIHLIYPGNYNKREISMSRTNPLEINIEKISKAIKIITNKSNFSKFLKILNKSIIDLLPLEPDDKEFRNKFIINDFRSKSVIYSSYCIYLFCEEENEDKEFHQFLGKYFIYNILSQRFKKREVDVMLDLRLINGESRDYNLLAKKINNELNEKFWTDTLPKKLLALRSRKSDISFVYQLALSSQFVFNSTVFKMKNWLFMKDKNKLEKKPPVFWLKIFPSDLLKKNYESSRPNSNSIFNYILIDHGNKSKGKLTRNRQAWGWLEDILTSVEGIESSIASGYFEAWDFPRNYEEEMKKFHNSSIKKKKIIYFTEFFDIRAKKMAKRIQDIFFPSG
ncbi:MAG: DUF262 domain-containing protein [Promethearchaeota archaeon]|nr:MAG: DUF262 domain-containing protein [Candidatus Lokiarchaeota archaeon]